MAKKNEKRIQVQVLMILMVAYGVCNTMGEINFYPINCTNPEDSNLVNHTFRSGGNVTINCTGKNDIGSGDYTECDQKCYECTVELEKDAFYAATCVCTEIPDDEDGPITVCKLNGSCTDKEQTNMSSATTELQTEQMSQTTSMATKSKTKSTSMTTKPMPKSTSTDTESMAKPTSMATELLSAIKLPTLTISLAVAVGVLSIFLLILMIIVALVALIVHKYKKQQSSLPSTSLDNPAYEQNQLEIAPTRIDARNDNQDNSPHPFISESQGNENGLYYNEGNPHTAMTSESQVSTTETGLPHDYETLKPVTEIVSTTIANKQEGNKELSMDNPSYAELHEVQSISMEERATNGITELQTAQEKISTEKENVQPLDEIDPQIENEMIAVAVTPISEDTDNDKEKTGKQPMDGEESFSRTNVTTVDSTVSQGSSQNENHCDTVNHEKIIEDEVQMTDTDESTNKNKEKDA